MREKCASCGGSFGELEIRNGQDCIICYCGRWQYNAPKTESGRGVRTVTTTHKAIKPKQRYRILERANRCCELCRKVGGELHVGHAISVKDGHEIGLSDDLINSDENLLALCDECNLGAGRKSLPLRILAGIIISRG